MNTDGSDPVNLSNDDFANDRFPSWSPDGSLLAFASDRIGDFEIYTMNADGTNLTQLTDSPANDRSPSWSADGTWIVFETDRDANSEVYGIGVDGTGPVNLSNDAGIDWAPMWSPLP